MINERLRETISDVYPYAVFIDNPYPDEAIVGVTDDGNIVYDEDKMIEAMKEEEGWTYDETLEWVEYNTKRALPYVKDGATPIIMNNIEDYL